MDHNMELVNQVTYIYPDSFITDAKSPTPDPFATVEEECFSQSQELDGKENIDPADRHLDMPDIDMDTNLNELVFDAGLVKRKSSLNLRI
jgi:hypothetical protein